MQTSMLNKQRLSLAYMITSTIAVNDAKPPVLTPKKVHGSGTATNPDFKPPMSNKTNAEKIATPAAALANPWRAIL